MLHFRKLNFLLKQSRLKSIQSSSTSNRYKLTSSSYFKLLVIDATLTRILLVTLVYMYNVKKVDENAMKTVEGMILFSDYVIREKNHLLLQNY